MGTHSKTAWLDVAEDRLRGGQMSPDEWAEVLVLLWDYLPPKFNSEVLKELEEIASR